MITNIDIDEATVAEAMSLSGARTKREVVDRALREMVARAKRPSFRDFAGIGGIDPDYDPKATGARGDELGRFRVEQPGRLHGSSAPSVAARKAASRSGKASAPATTAVPPPPARRSKA